MTTKLQPSKHETLAQATQRLRVLSLKDDGLPMWPPEHGCPPRDALKPAPELYVALAIEWPIPQGIACPFRIQVEPTELKQGSTLLLRVGSSDTWMVHR